MAQAPLLMIVLAAGKGTRMNSALPKVMHKIAGRSMLGHVLALSGQSEARSVAVVVGPDMDAVASEAVAHVPSAQIFVQHNQRGTADAVLAARAALQNHSGDVMILYGDTPLLQPETLGYLTAALDAGAHVAVLGFRAKDPTGYGRLLTDSHGDLQAIREHKDASDAERQIDLCNSGVMAFRVPRLAELLSRIGNDNAKSEFYLTDAVAMAREDNLRCVVVACDENEVLGVNTRDQLATAEAIWQSRQRAAFMRDGVTMTAPETVWLSYDTKIGIDVTVEPNVFIGPGVTIEDGVDILANCHIVGAHISAGARVGPFARLRPGAKLGTNVHVGNFVEVKNSDMAAGSKANHLAYVGDGSVGAGANIGAGTIFCNYDGFTKHRTTIGEGAFIGSNSSLVAPVKVGAGAYVGSGSVITKDVSPGALALERCEQEERPGWAEKFRIMMSRRKAKS